LGQFAGSKIGLIGLYHAKKMDDWWMVKIQDALAYGSSAAKEIKMAGPTALISDT